MWFADDQLLEVHRRPLALCYRLRGPCGGQLVRDGRHRARVSSAGGVEQGTLELVHSSTALAELEFAAGASLRWRLTLVALAVLFRAERLGRVEA